MITITPCTTSDCVTLAQLWSHMTGIAESCWYQATEPTAEEISTWQDAGMIFVLAKNDELAVGFGFWRAAGDRLKLHALAAETAEVYYRLVAAAADWGIAQGLVGGSCEISPRETREMSWMTELDSIVVDAVGHEPLTEGQDPALRTIELLRVSANLAALRQSALDELGG